MHLVSEKAIAMSTQDRFAVSNAQEIWFTVIVMPACQKRCEQLQ